MTINVPDNERMELVYLYVEKANGEEYDLHLDFSQDIQIRWDKEKEEFSIKKLENKLPKSFFGKYITNITSIVGKNGAGKTSIINNLMLKSDTKINKWIMIYLYQDQYIIEGNIYNLFAIEQEVSSSFGFDNYAYIGHIHRKFVPLSALSESPYKQDIALFQFSHTQKSNFCNDFLSFNRFVPEKIKYKAIYQFLFNETIDKNFNIRIPNLIVDLQTHNLSKQYKNEANLLGRDVRLYLEQLRKDYENRFTVIKRQEQNTHILLLFHQYILYSLIIKLAIELDALKVNSKENNTRKFEYKITELFHAITKSPIDLFDIEILESWIFEILNGNYFPSRNGGFNITHDDFLSVVEALKSQESNIRVFDSQLSFYNLYDYGHYTDLMVTLDFIDKWNLAYDNLPDMMFCTLGAFSEGEQSILHGLAQINANISSHKLKKMIVILLDEYEQHLHPEWSRKYLFYLLKFLDAEGERLGIKFQVILTTHSPYLISDLPKENIILLEKDEKTGNRTARKSNYGFASNYYDIMSDNFFLDDTIGEFAKQKINGCIQAINRISDDLDKLANDELILHEGLSLFIKESLEVIEEQNKIINLVGDKFIQKQLQQLSDSVKQRLLVHSDDSVRKQQLEQDIAELEERIRQKKMELNND